jgi:hypothetical protein
MPLTPGLAQTELVDRDGYMTQPWQTHFRDVQTSIELAPARLSTETIDTETLAAIGALPPTPILPDEPLQTGLYRVTATLRVTVPATTSSSVAVVLHWFDGVDCTLVLVPPVTGNVPSAVGTGTALIHVVADLNSLVMISTQYASVPDLAMKYALHIVLEKMGGG